MPVQFYPAIIYRNTSGFGVSFPDFPTCMAAGDTVNEAAAQAELALAFHVKAMVQEGDALPAPNDYAEAMRPAEKDDVAGLLVRVDTPAKVARVLVSLDENLLRAIDAVATNRSAWLAEVACAALRSHHLAIAKGGSLVDVIVDGVTDAAAAQASTVRAALVSPSALKAAGQHLGGAVGRLAL